MSRRFRSGLLFDDDAMPVVMRSFDGASRLNHSPWRKPGDSGWHHAPDEEPSRILRKRCFDAVEDVVEQLPSAGRESVHLGDEF